MWVRPFMIARKRGLLPSASRAPMFAPWRSSAHTISTLPF